MHFKSTQKELWSIKFEAIQKDQYAKDCLLQYDFHGDKFEYCSNLYGGKGGNEAAMESYGILDPLFRLVRKMLRVGRKYRWLILI